ncbi:hypothetical protein YC2023_088525 [Brassica napus]
MVKWCPQTQENTGRPSEELKWVIREFKEELLCCFYSIALGGLRSFENPKNKINAIPA